MGLGKTLIALAAVAVDLDSVRASLHAMANPPPTQVLIAVPNSVLWNWDSEIKKFFQGAA